MIEAVREFLSLFDQDEPVSEDALAHALDALAFAYHSTPHGNPSAADTEPEKEDYRLMRVQAGKLFPGLGLYGIADPMEVVNEKAMVGDAIDDICDIARDLKEVLWRWRNLGADDAHWHFRFGYQTHWGRHLHELRLYLHAKQF
jgi:hypothetical protein